MSTWGEARQNIDFPYKGAGLFVIQTATLSVPKDMTSC